MFVTTVIVLLHITCHQWLSETYLIYPSVTVWTMCLCKVTEKDGDRDGGRKDKK